MAPTTVLWLFICNYLVFAQGELQLKLLQTVFRHGDRSPVTSFPNDIHNDAWPQGFGQLSKIGMNQHYELGSYIRESYAVKMSFLSQNYSRNEVYVRSTDVDRTLMSAYSHLAGLYPPAPGDRFRLELDWQPLPVHTVEDANDHLLNPDAPCPLAEKHYAEYLNSPEIRQEEEENKPFYDFIMEKTAMTYENLSDIWVVHDALFCEKQHNLSMPEWLNDTLWEQLTNLSSLEFDSKYGTKDQGRLRGGPLVREMLGNMEMKINNSIQPQERKLMIYSGHDSTVSAFLGALRVFDDIMPPYAACVMVELWQNDSTKEYSVRMLYKNNTEPTALVLDGCKEYCPWGQFVNLTSDMVPGADWHKECSLSSDSSSFWTRRDIIVVATGCSVFVISVLLVVILVAVKRRRNRDNGYSLNYEGLHEET